MKKKFLAILFLALLGGTTTLHASYDFEANGVYFSITNQDAGTVSVTSGDNKYAGDITIPESVSHEGKTYAVTAIGNNAFQTCTELTSVSLPASLKIIGSRAFSLCTGLSSITIPEGVTSIEDYSFSGCSSLTSVSVPNTVASLGREAFSHCSGMTSVTFSEGLKSIGIAAFTSCIGLTSITIPASVTSIEERAFTSCSSLTSIEVKSGNKTYDSRNGCNAIIEKASNTLLIGCQNSIIPDNIKAIGDEAFYSCIGLKSITIPASVTSIGEQAFMGCMGLNTIEVKEGNRTYDSRNECNAIIETATNTLIVGCHATVIPESVTHIGSNAFYGCGNLSSITIPEGVTSIGDNAFISCSLMDTVYLPKSLTAIGSRAFSFCTSLNDVYCYAANVPVASADAFDYSNYEKAKLHVYDYTYDAYSTTEPWSNFGEIVKEREIKPCATPTISFVGGKLIFKSETEGATFTYDIKDDDIKSGTGSEVALTATYQISVYASAEYCYDSEVATATLCWIAVEPKTEGLTDEDAVAEVKALPVLIQTDGNAITVQGAGNGTEVSVYSPDGRKHDSMVSVGGSVTLNTSLQPGTIAIVKIGDNAVKVLMK